MYLLHENNKSDIGSFINYFKSYLLNIEFLKINVTNFKKKTLLGRVEYVYGGKERWKKIMEVNGCGGGKNT